MRRAPGWGPTATYTLTQSHRCLESSGSGVLSGGFSLDPTGIPSASTCSCGTHHLEKAMTKQARDKLNPLPGNASS